MRRSTLKDPSKESWDIIILAGQSNAEGSGFVETDGLPSNTQEKANEGLDPVECIHFSREALYQLGHRYFRMFLALR